MKEDIMFVFLGLAYFCLVDDLQFYLFSYTTHTHTHKSRFYNFIYFPTHDVFTFFFMAK